MVGGLIGVAVAGTCGQKGCREGSHPTAHSVSGTSFQTREDADKQRGITVMRVKFVTFENAPNGATHYSYIDDGKIELWWWRLAPQNEANPWELWDFPTGRWLSIADLCPLDPCKEIKEENFL